MCGLGCRVHVLDDEEVEAVEHVLQMPLVDPRVRSVGGHDPQTLDGSAEDLLEDLVVGQARPVGDALHIDPERVGHFAAVHRVREVPASEQSRGVAEQAGAHGVALPGDRVGAGAGPTDVAGHEGQGDYGLGAADPFMTLVHAHGPPERDPLTVVDGRRETLDLVDRKAGSCADGLRRERGDMRGEGRELRGMGAYELGVDPAMGDQAVGDPVEQREVRLRREGVVLGGGGCGFGGAGVDDDDLGGVRIAADPLPHDRVGNAEVRSDEHDHVRLLEVGVGVRRRVEAEGLLVGDDRRGHALAGVAVAVDHAHAELRKRAEHCHLLGRDLAGGDERHGLGPVTLLDGLEAFGQRGRSGGPVDRT